MHHQRDWYGEKQKQQNKQIKTNIAICVFVVKVTELWDRLTWLRGRSFLFKDDVLDADPSRSRGFQRSVVLRMVAELPACSS